jgi:hypothetical protein
MPLLSAYMRPYAVIRGSRPRIHDGVARRQSGRWAQQDPMRQWHAWYGTASPPPKRP